MRTVEEPTGGRPGPWKALVGGIVVCSLLGALAILTGSLRRQYWANGETYRIGWDPDPPEQVAAGTGEPTGLAVELVKEAARRRGIGLRWVRHHEGSETALRTGAVDLWPLITITPERLKVIHISAPYLDAVTSFVIRRDSGLRTVEDLAGKAVGYVAVPRPGSIVIPINLRLASQFAPEARYTAVGSPRALIAGVCNKDLAAGFVEQNAVIGILMADGFACGPGFAMITPPNSRIRLGIGSTNRAAPAADALRDEMDGMALDGRMESEFSKWGYLSGRTVSYVESLRSSRQRERWIELVACVFAILFLLALLQTWRYFREGTRARRAEAALRKSIAESRLLAQALRSAQDCICVSDMDGRILYVNEACLRTYEYEEGELIGQPVEIFRSTHPDRLVDPELSAAMAGEGWRGELWSRSKTGRDFPISLARSRVRDEKGNVIALVGVARDITERRKAEEEYRKLQAQYLQAQKLESVGQLAGGVAHDFNNLLTVILGYSRKLLSAMDAEDPAREPLAQIASAADKAARLTRQLLTFSRQNAGAPKVVSLDEIVIGLEPMLRRLIEESIEVILAPEADRTFIFADPALVEQVVVNLAVNGRDAMPEGGRLFIETSRTTVADEFAAKCLSVPVCRYAMLSVTDNGTGMEPEVQARIFEPFFTTKEPGKGSGLGLSTVYGIVKQSGGAITVHSTPGVGTSIKVFFPAANAADAEEAKPEPVAIPARGNETVLLVEDETGVRNYVREVLEEYGYRVLDAANGTDAIEMTRRCDRTRIDLLLTDMVLPGMNGVEVIRHFSALRPGVPVVRMSGYPERFAAQMLDDIPYLPKPFTPEALLEMVGRTLATAANACEK
jgi:PAS domain S-box-containing protein